MPPGTLILSLWGVVAVLSLFGWSGPSPGEAPAPPAPPPPVPLAAPGPPTAAPPAVRRVLLVGASSMQHDLGIALEAELARRGLEMDRFGKAATGLSHPEELDWSARLDRLLDRHHPDLVVANFGGNDATSIPLGNHRWAEFGTPNWDEVYSGRIADLVARVRARKAQMVFIGMPIMRSPKFSARMQRLNEITRRAAEGAGGLYLDQWDISATPEGKYRETIEVDGRRRLLRHVDGIHYSLHGGRWAARKLAERLEALVPGLTPASRR